MRQNVHRIYNNGRLVVQTADEQDGLAEPPLAVSHDAVGLLIVMQDGRDVLINRATLPALIHALRDVAKHAAGRE